MGSGGNAAGSGAAPAGAVPCHYGPQLTEGKPTGAQGRPRPEYRKRRASTARSASANRYREQRTVAGNCTGRQPGSRVRAHGKLCGRCRGGDMSTPQKCPSTGHYLRRLQTTADRRGSLAVGTAACDAPVLVVMDCALVGTSEFIAADCGGGVPLARDGAVPVRGMRSRGPPSCQRWRSWLPGVTTAPPPLPSIPGMDATIELAP